MDRIKDLISLCKSLDDSASVTIDLGSLRRLASIASSIESAIDGCGAYCIQGSVGCMETKTPSDCPIGRIVYGDPK